MLLTCQRIMFTFDKIIRIRLDTNICGYLNASTFSNKRIYQQVDCRIGQIDMVNMQALANLKLCHWDRNYKKIQVMTTCQFDKILTVNDRTLPP